MKTSAGARILVIDDEVGIRDMLVFGLSDLGFDLIATAASGEEALEKAEGTAFHLAICDILMPGMGGIDTLKALKAADPSIEVIMATGSATLSTAVEAKTLGAFDYVVKPYDLDELIDLLAAALERRLPASPP